MSSKLMTPMSKLKVESDNNNKTINTSTCRSISNKPQQGEQHLLKQQTMEEDQQQQRLNSSILQGIARLSQPRHRNERHKLIVDGFKRPRVRVDRQSWEHLVNFLDGDSHEVTELELKDVRLPHPSDGGLDVLRGFFSRSDTTLTKVALRCGNFGRQQEAFQLIVAFQTNRTVVDLTIRQIRNLEGAALGACLSRLIQNMPQLQRLNCSECALRVEGVRALQPALQVNRTLKNLNLYWCKIGDEGLRLLVDALVGNTTMDILNIGHNDLASNGLGDITRLLESTRLKGIDLAENYRVFSDEASIQQFARILSRHEFLKELGLSRCLLGKKGIRLVVDGLVGNTILETLEVSENPITSDGLADITRLLESTQLRTISICHNRDIFNHDYATQSFGIFDDEDATQHFVSTLQYKKSSVQELPGIEPDDFPGDEDSQTTMLASINNSLTRNQQLNLVNFLLAPPPPQHQSPQTGSTTFLIKTWHKAITKFAAVPNNAGASAIFKLFQARPALLEKRLKRPVAAAAGAVSHEQKRRRL